MHNQRAGAGCQRAEQACTFKRGEHTVIFLNQPREAVACFTLTRDSFLPALQRRCCP